MWDPGELLHVWTRTKTLYIYYFQGHDIEFQEIFLIFMLLKAGKRLCLIMETTMDSPCEIFNKTQNKTKVKEARFLIVIVLILFC